MRGYFEHVQKLCEDAGRLRSTGNQRLRVRIDCAQNLCEDASKLDKFTSKTSATEEAERPH